MFDLQTNIADFARELKQRAERIEANQKRAMSAAARSLFVTSKNKLRTLIYNKELPRRKNGRIAWRRTYQLLRAERVSTSTRGDKGEIFTDPGSKANRSARARHKLNRPSPIDGKVRRAPWRSEAHKTGASRAVDAYRESIAKD
jgi:hypothetical protein